MAEKDYVREIAKALAEEKGIHALGMTLLAEIQAKRNRLQQQAMTIQNLMTLYPDQPVPTPKANVVQTPTPPPTPDLVAPTVSDGQGLTEGQKFKLMELAVSILMERGLDKEIDPGEVLDRLAAQGEHLSVQQPRSVVGVYLYRARQRLEKTNGHRAGSPAQPAAAGRSKGGR